MLHGILASALNVFQTYKDGFLFQEVQAQAENILGKHILKAYKNQWLDVLINFIVLGTSLCTQLRLLVLGS